MLDKVKSASFVLLYCLVSTVLFSRCGCDEQTLADRRTGEPSVGLEPMISRPAGGQAAKSNGGVSTNESNRLDMINLINSLSDNSCVNRTDCDPATSAPIKASKQARSGISVVHSDLDGDQETKRSNGVGMKREPTSDRKASAQRRKNSHRKTNRPSLNQIMNQSYQDYIYLEQPSNRHYNKYGGEEPQNNDQTRVQAADEEGESKKCEDLSGTNENSDLLFENVLMSAGHDFQAVNTSHTAENGKPNRPGSNEQHRSSTDTVDYQTAINLANGDYLAARQPAYPSEHFTPSSRFSKAHQLTSRSQHRSNQNAIETPALEGLNLMSRQLDFRIAGGRGKKSKKSGKQLNKRLDLDESYGEDEEEEKNEDDDDPAPSRTAGDPNKLETGGERLLSQLSQELNGRPETAGHDLEYSREFDKSVADRNLFDSGSNELNGEQNYEQVRQQIQSQIQSQNYNQKLDELVNQFVADQKKQLKLKRKNSLQRFPNYQLQYLHDQHPASRYIPLHNLRYAPPQNLRKTRSQSKLRSKLTMDRGVPPESLDYSFLPAFYGLGYPPASWYQVRRNQKKGKVDDNYYRKLILLRKQQALLSSILGKNALQFKMINHELQPDSSDDLYSYSPIGEFELGDYESEIATAIPQSQSMSSLVNYPALMMSYYANPYRYYSMPTMPSSYMPMAAPMMMQAGYPYDPYRSTVPSSSNSRYGDGYQQNRYTEHHHEHMYPTPVPMPMPMPMHPPSFNHVVRNYKKNDLKEMIWPLLFAVVLPLTFGALLLPLTLMFLVNLFMLLQILRNPNDFTNPNPDQGDGGAAAAKIIKYKTGLLSLSPSLRTDFAASNSTETTGNPTKSQRRSRRSAVRRPPLSPMLNKRKVNESHLRFLTSLIQFQRLIDQGDGVHLKRAKYS